MPAEGSEGELEYLRGENRKWREINKEQQKALREQKSQIVELQGILQELMAKKKAT